MEWAWGFTPNVGSHSSNVQRLRESIGDSISKRERGEETGEISLPSTKLLLLFMGTGANVTPEPVLILLIGTGTDVTPEPMLVLFKGTGTDVAPE